MTTVRVLLADDEAMIRAGVRAILATDPAIEVVAEAADGHAAVELTRAHRPDVALLDIRMPVLDGLRAADEIGAVAPATAVVMLTTFSDDAYISRALASGVAGFLLKASDPRDLITAVHAAAGGAAYLSPAIARRVIDDYRDPGRVQARQRVAALTGREREVLALLGAGHSNAEIGRTLHLVEGTVKAHVSSILVKLDARNRVRAAIVAHQAGLP
jgi:DNA-binding NarL/FixJ family response regulator